MSLNEAAPQRREDLLVKAEEALIFKTVTDPENVRSYGGEG